jgi:hypothetical protein
MLFRGMPWTYASRYARFVGWFGLVGAAALLYACMAEDMTSNTEL